MLLDSLRQDDRAQTILWFILADHASAPELEEALLLLAPRVSGGDGSASVLILPHHGNAANSRALPAAGGLDIASATHGSAIEPRAVRILPADRLFVLEDNVLQLRPRDLAHQISPCDHLLPSLARAYGPRLQILPLGDGPAAGMESLAAARAMGAALTSLEDLRTSQDAAPARTVELIGTRPRQPDRKPPAPEVLPGHLAHDLRQPLQTATLLQGLLARQVQEPRTLELIERLGETLRHMADLIAHPAPSPAPAVGLAPEPAAPDLPDGPLVTAAGTPATVYIIDDDRSVRDALRAVLEEEGCAVSDFERCEDFLDSYSGEADGCLLVDAYLPGMSGMELLNRLHQGGSALPAIMITGSSDVQTAVRAMKAGAADFIEKPVGTAELLSGVRQALALARGSGADGETRERAAQCLQSLTKRQKQIMAMVLDGHPSKIIAADLGISQRTVENHRAAIMKKTGSRSLPALARLAMALQPHLN